MNYSYISTPLMERINKHFLLQRHPLAFAACDFGEGAILTYRGHHIRLSTLSVDLRQGDQHIELSHLSQPPYFVAVAQDAPRQPLLLVLYGSGPTPMLECSTDDRLVGQVFAFGGLADGSRQMLAHALCLPGFSNVFAQKNLKYSILLEEHPELCEHLFLCGGMINALLSPGEGGDTNG